MAIIFHKIIITAIEKLFYRKKPRNILIKTKIVLSFLSCKKPAHINIIFLQGEYSMDLLWVARLSQNGFHPLMPFIAFGRFVPGKITCRFVVFRTQRHRFYLQ